MNNSINKQKNVEEQRQLTPISIILEEIVEEMLSNIDNTDPKIRIPS